jgi:hypothetical protein
MLDVLYIYIYLPLGFKELNRRRKHALVKTTHNKVYNLLGISVMKILCERREDNTVRWIVDW